MADYDLRAPLLVPERLKEAKGEAEVTIDIAIDDGDARPPHHYRTTQLDNLNPFEFLGAGSFSLPSPTPIDPFRNQTPNIEGLYEWLKILVCIPLAIVRLVFFGLSLLVGFVATKFALYGWKDKHNPMPRWSYHWIRRRGRPASRETAPIVVSNHVSYIDPIFFFYELFPTIVASESHDAIPFVGTIIRAMQVIYVNRFSAPSRKHAVNEIKVEYLPVVAPFENQKENAVHFAERTSYAIANALNVIQTSHSYGDLMLLTRASESKQKKASNYMVEMAKAEHSFHISTLEAVEFLDMFLSMNPDPSGRVKIHDFLRILRLRASPLSEKCSPAVVFSSNNVLIKTMVGFTNLPRYTPQFKKEEGYKSLSGRYAIHVRQGCKLTCSCLPFHEAIHSSSSLQIFGFIDVEKHGSITFRQFLFGSVHVMKQPLFRQACELAFAECESRGYGSISKQQLGDFVRPGMQDIREEEICELFILFDTDSDGVVSKNDFMTCLRRNPLLIALFSHVLLHKGLLEANDGRSEEIVG
ncbi:hypothetical protein HHK36_000301 [Tetracentron sinense]|uniref:EF-hand domain-containing protein n=1 Tax=Tetracentron sinense TaxID=13715 RepID=A0A835DTM6_TETSI|nr:hypothetical protein HHK36_000301 [Tetracentron sinense]